MDASFEVLVPFDTEFVKLKFEIPFFEWQGEKYPQGLPESSFGSSFQLKEMEHYNFKNVEESIPLSLKNIKWKVISIQGDGLDNYVAELFGFGMEEIGFTLRDLLYTLLGDLQNWIVIFGPQYDGFDVAKRGDIEDVLVDLEDSLKIESRGFLIYH